MRHAPRVERKGWRLRDCGLPLRPEPLHAVAAMPPWVPESVRPALNWALSPPALAWASGVSLVFFVGSILALPWLVARLPEDYFVHDDDPPSAILRRPGAVTASRLLRNALGVLLLFAGVAMLVLPGQGLLTIIVALGLIEFRGKRALQRRLVSRPSVLSTLNKIRARAGKPPLVLERSDAGT